MSAPYRLQRRRDGVTLKQGQSWIMLRRNEIADLITQLQRELDYPNGVEEINGIQTTNHR